MLEIVRVTLMIVCLDRFLIVCTDKKFNSLNLVCRKGMLLTFKNRLHFYTLVLFISV